MPLHIGNTNIGAIYKGTTPISSIYKGTTLVFSSYSWQEWYNEYIYNALIPTTLNNKQVQDKAKLVEIQGNSCVVNQLCNIAPNFSSTIRGVDVSTDSNCKITFNGSATSGGGRVSFGYLFSRTNPNFISGHKYFINSIKINAPLIITKVNNTDWWSPILSANTTNAIYSYIDETTPMYIGWNLISGETYNTSGYVYIIDLTQQFPFDTPTSIDDPRVKRIIEQGYIPYNSGEIKDSVVGEISSQGYNLFDGEIELGWINSAGGLTTDTNTWRSKNYTQVVGGFEYTLSNALSGYTNMYVYQYDKDKTLIKFRGLGSTSIPSYSITLENETKYIKFAYYKNGANFTNNLPPLSETQLCLHRTGTRTGYADYIPQQYLPSEYQEVEYLESSGTQYIDTGFKPNQDTKTLITYNKVSNGSVEVQYLFGVYNASYGYAVQLNNGNTAFIWANQDSGGGQPINPLNQKCVIEFGKNGFYRDNVLLATPTSATFSSSVNMYLFWANGTSRDYIRAKLYSCKLYDNDTLIRNFIPCYRKSDNVAGLYDLVNNLFYTNNGTGTFIVGKKVNNNTMIKLPAPLELGGARNSHNKFEITKTEYVFTRDMWNYTFSGSETWILEGNYQKYYTSMNVPDNLSAKGVSTSFYGNILCEEYITERQNELSSGRVDKAIAIGSNATTKTICVRDTTHITSTATAQSYMTGKTIHYQLATPQVINIPRKHLKVLDLGSISWEIGGSGNYWVPVSYNLEDAKAPATVNNTPNIWCSRYMTSVPGSSVFYAKDKAISLSVSKWIYIKDSELPTDGTITATDFKNAMSGIYLYYETQNEVQDFNDEMFIQSGGTITTDSEVLPNLTLGVKCK